MKLPALEGVKPHPFGCVKLRLSRRGREAVLEVHFLGSKKS
jgi:hypothetical protein